MDELLNILGHETMTAVVEEFKEPNHQLVELFPPTLIEGDTAEWDIYKASRGIGEFNVRNAPSKPVKLSPKGHKTAQCFKAFDHKRLGADTLANLRAPGMKERAARAHITREQLDLFRKHARMREYCRAQALTGTLTVNQDDVKITVNYGLSASHKPTAAASWATATTDIPGDVATWKKLVAKDSGRAAARAYCNSSVMAYMLANDNVKELLGDGAYKAQVGKDGHITRFMGLGWRVYDDGYLNGSGTFVPFISDDKLIITPEPGEWGSMQVGGTKIPSDDGSELVDVQAPYAYVELTKDPAGVKLLQGDIFLPVLPIPDSIVYADVTP